MRRIRYLSLLPMLCGCLAAWGQNSGDFNPGSPGEPGVPPSKLVLLVTPTGSGTASCSTTGVSGGKYTPGTTLSLTARNNANYVFDHWADAQGNVLATTSSFSHVKSEKTDTLVAHFRFLPGSPAAPNEPATTLYFRLTIGTVVGGTASGGGRYQAGKSVRLSCSAASGFEFVGWYNSAGEQVSTTASFTYTTTARDETLTPRFRFNPGSPNEPNVPVLSHNLAVAATEGGTVTAGSNRLQEGASTTVRATPNTGYKFVRWLKNGEPYTALESFSYTMEEKGVAFWAEFRWEPDSPSEPVKPTAKKYAYYLMSVIGKPGDLLHYPIYLTNLDPLCDMTFQLTFPQNLKPDLASVGLSEKAQGYTVSYTATNDTSYVFTLVGGRTAAGNTLLLSFDVPVPEDMPTGQSYQVKINQVSVTEEDGPHLTASTRNGRIYVYRRGDTNGDGNVDLLDKRNLVLHVLNEKTESFIGEVSDVNEDGMFDLMDCKGVIDIIITDEQ